MSVGIRNFFLDAAVSSLRSSTISWSYIPNSRRLPIQVLYCRPSPLQTFLQTVWWTLWLRKIFQAVLCPTQLFQWKLICTFNQHCLSYKISNRLQFNSSLFPHKLFKMLLHWHTSFQHVPHVENTFKYINTKSICLLLVCIKGKLVLLLAKNWLCFTRNQTKVHWQSKFLLSLSLQVVLYQNGAFIW